MIHCSQCNPALCVDILDGLTLALPAREGFCTPPQPLPRSAASIYRRSIWRHFAMISVERMQSKVYGQTKLC